MKTIEITAFAIKALSVYVFIQSINTFTLFFETGSISEIAYAEFASASYTRLAFHLALILLAIFMWNFPISIAKWFIPKSNDSNYSEVQININNIEMVGFSIIGIYILSWAVPDLIDNFGFINLMKVYPEVYQQYQVKEMNITLVVTFIEVFIGFMLCAFSGSLSKLLTKLRSHRV